MTDLSRFLVAGKGRESVDGFDPRFGQSLAAMFAAAPPDVQAQLRIGSGFRSVGQQQQLWNQALQKYGSPDAARKWVAPPGRSNHNHGYAADLSYLNPAAMQWAHANAGKFGLAFPLSNENWHIELAGIRNGQQPTQPTAQPAPQTIAANFAPTTGDDSFGAQLLTAMAKPQPTVYQPDPAEAEAKRAKRQALYDGANLWS